MSCVTSTCSQNLTLDPYKHVCYSQGLVLGVDEFVQEEIYFLGQHRWHNRGLHGYGTVCGLEVRISDTTRGPEISVAPGMALDPIGHRIRVAAAQCAYLNEWLARFGDTLQSPPSSSPGADAELFLRLCFRECATDSVPIPGGPCRSADETSAPSRVLDDFCLKLTTTPPDQTEADVVRAFGRLLRSIRFTDEEPPNLALADLVAMVRDLPTHPLSPGQIVASPPESPFLGWRVATADAELFIHTAFRTWVTEVRPDLLPDGRNCAGGPPDGDCILLARLTFPVTPGATGLVVNGLAGDIGLDESKRPYVIHTQLLQELFGNGAFGFGTRDHSALNNLDRDDHHQYLPVDPATRALVADLDANGHRVVALANGAVAGDAMPVGQAAAGDLAGAYPAPTVARIQGFGVNALAPSNNNVLTWDATLAGGTGEWVPRPAQTSTGGTNAETNLTRIVALSWQHNAPHLLTFNLDGRPTFGIAVAFDGGVRMTSASHEMGHPRLDLGSLDEHSFQVFVEAIDTTISESRRRVRLSPVAIFPIDPAVSGGRITSGTTPAAPSNRVVSGKAVFLKLSTKLDSIMADIRDARVYVELSGDHVIADDGRAIDAEFVRSALPTGDRPAGNALGIQGGLFRSWFRYGADRIRRPLDLNRATVVDLLEIGMTHDEANAAVDFRIANGPFTAMRELASVPGFDANVLRRFDRRVLTIG